LKLQEEKHSKKRGKNTIEKETPVQHTEWFSQSYHADAWNISSIKQKSKVLQTGSMCHTTFGYGN